MEKTVINSLDDLKEAIRAYANGRIAEINEQLKTFSPGAENADPVLLSPRFHLETECKALEEMAFQIDARFSNSDEVLIALNMYGDNLNIEIGEGLYDDLENKFGLDSTTMIFNKIRRTQDLTDLSDAALREMKDSFPLGEDIHALEQFLSEVERLYKENKRKELRVDSGIPQIPDDAQDCAYSLLPRVNARALGTDIARKYGMYNPDKQYNLAAKCWRDFFGDTHTPDEAEKIKAVSHEITNECDRHRQQIEKRRTVIGGLIGTFIGAAAAWFSIHKGDKPEMPEQSPPEQTVKGQIPPPPAPTAAFEHN